MKAYQCIEADNIIEFEQRISKAISIGYIPIGSVSVVQTLHNIKGTQSIYRQSLWYAENVHSASSIIQEQHAFLTDVVENARPLYDDMDKTTEIDIDIVDAIESYIRGGNWCLTQK